MNRRVRLGDRDVATTSAALSTRHFPFVPPALSRADDETAVPPTLARFAWRRKTPLAFPGGAGGGAIAARLPFWRRRLPPRGTSPRCCLPSIHHYIPARLALA